MSRPKLKAPENSGALTSAPSRVDYRGMNKPNDGTTVPDPSDIDNLDDSHMRCEDALAYTDWGYTNTPAGVILALDRKEGSGYDDPWALSVSAQLVPGFWIVDSKWTDQSPFVRFGDFLTLPELVYDPDEEQSADE